MSPVVSHKPIRDGYTHQRGFTLLEVMVALAVIATAMAAVITTVATGVRNSAGLQERTLAHWVAMNQMTTLEVSKQWPALRTTTGSEIMAEHEWFWSQDVQKVPAPEAQQFMRKVIIQVRINESDESPMATLTGFVFKP